MTLAKTITGLEIPKDAKGILYLCEIEDSKIVVEYVRMYRTEMAAVDAYANIPNPASHVVTGKSYEELIQNLDRLHLNLVDPKYFDELMESL